MIPTDSSLFTSTKCEMVLNAALKSYRISIDKRPESAVTNKNLRDLHKCNLNTTIQTKLLKWPTKRKMITEVECNNAFKNFWTKIAFWKLEEN